MTNEAENLKVENRILKNRISELEGRLERADSIIRRNIDIYQKAIKEYGEDLEELKGNN